MDKELRILILEDNPADAELEEYELRKAGLVFTSRIVDTEETFLKELDDFIPDIILSDYDLPTFDGLAALRLAKEKCPDIPFIIVSGKLGEEFAIEKLKEGATDYVLKNNLKRLVPVINRALKEAKLRTERKHAEEALWESEKTARILVNIPVAAAFLLDRQGICLDVNETLATKLGRKRSDFIGNPIWDFFPSDVIAKRKVNFETVLRDKKQIRYEVEYEGRWTDVIISPILDTIGEVAKVAVLGFDITEHKKAATALLDSEKRFRLLVESSPDAIFVQTRRQFAYLNPAALTLLGAESPEQLLGQLVIDRLHPDFRELVSERIRLLNEEKKAVSNSEQIYLRIDGSQVYVEVSAVPITFGGEDGALVFMRDITDRKRAEKEIEIRVKELEDFYNIAIDRELRMIELKKRIEELKEKLEKYENP